MAVLADQAKMGALVLQIAEAEEEDTVEGVEDGEGSEVLRVEMDLVGVLPVLMLLGPIAGLRQLLFRQLLDRVELWVAPHPIQVALGATAAL
jgi:hypothetical protein